MVGAEGTVALLFTGRNSLVNAATHRDAPRSATCGRLGRVFEGHQQELSFTAGGRDPGTATLEDGLAVSYMLSLHGPAVRVIGIYPKWWDIDPLMDVYTSFLFTIAKTWEQPRRPSVGDG